MDEYIRREGAIKKTHEEWDECCDFIGSGSEIADTTVMALCEIPLADVVPWEWLKQYADGKRVNFASGFVLEAERAYKENNNES